MLNESAVQSGVKNRFFAIVDKDSNPQIPVTPGASEFSWDVYHIENYLLDISAVRLATAMLSGEDESSMSDPEILDKLRQCAEKLVNGLVMEKISSEINDEFVNALNIRGNPDSVNPEVTLLPAIEKSIGRVRSVETSWSSQKIKERASAYRTELSVALEDGSWISEFPGRKILRRYVDHEFRGKINASFFMNTVLDKMVDRAVRPPGMESVLNLILVESSEDSGFER
ncbi:hypothetical protein AB0M83_21245 [Amycolatopsis sp. NPDC051106]|uniref:hypothetical protein n=1 Tax=unclassified Amycolatopsis TaxID=2618356 RepID=UPI00343CB8B7